MRLQSEKGGYLELKFLKRGVLGAYLFIIFTFTCQNDQSVGVFCQTEKGRGVLGVGTARKGRSGVSGAGHVNISGSLLRHIHILDI